MTTIRLMKNRAQALLGAERAAMSSVLHMAEGEVSPVTLDLTDMLETGVSISAATSSQSGLTLTTPTISAGKVTTNVTAPNGYGYADIKATLSTGQVIVHRLTAFEAPAFNLHSDYV